MTSPKNNRGVITIATGEKVFAEMAVDMALSYKALHTEPVSCLVDDSLEQYMSSIYGNVFEHIIPISDKSSGNRKRKFSVAKHSPYEHTLFIDADVLILNSINHLWIESHETPLMMLGEYLTSGANINHHGFETAKIIEEFELEQYLKTNSGVFAFKKSLSQDIFESCAEVYDELLYRKSKIGEGWIGDEIAFGVVGGRLKIPFFKSPSPMMWPEQLLKLQPGDISTPICHFIGEIPNPALKWLVGNCRARRFQSGITPISATHWYMVNYENVKIRRAPSFFEKLIFQLRKGFS